MTNENINLYNSTNPTTPDTPIKSVTMPRDDKPEPLANINMGELLREPLHLQYVKRVHGNKYMGEVKHFGLVRVLEIELWNEDIELIEKTLNITVGERYDFPEPLEFYAKKYIGHTFKNILRIENLTFTESVQTLSPEPEKTDAELRALYKFHGETMTCETAIEKGRGVMKVWQIAMRASDGTLLRIDAWSEHNRMLQEAGYGTLPERGAGVLSLDAEVVIEYNLKYSDYRITHVYPKQSEAVAAPVEAQQPPIGIANAIEAAAPQTTNAEPLFELQQYQAGEWSKVDSSSHAHAVPMLLKVARDPRMTVARYGLIWRIIRASDRHFIAGSKEQPKPEAADSPVSESTKPAPVQSPFQTRFGLQVELLKWIVPNECVQVRYEDGTEKEVALSDLRAPNGLEQITKHLDALTPIEPVSAETMDGIKARLNHIKEHGLFDDDDEVTDVVEIPAINDKQAANGSVKTDELNVPVKDAYERFKDAVQPFSLEQINTFIDILLDVKAEKEAEIVETGIV